LDAGLHARAGLDDDVGAEALSFLTVSGVAATRARRVDLSGNSDLHAALAVIPDGGDFGTGLRSDQEIRLKLSRITRKPIIHLVSVMNAS